MTLSKLIAHARYGCAMSYGATDSEYKEIRDFEKTWTDLMDKELEDLHLMQVTYFIPIEDA